MAAHDCALPDVPGSAITVVVTDCIDIAGLPAEGGSAALDDAPPAGCHAAMVEALSMVGCRITGKADVRESAYAATGINARTGSPVIPHLPDCVLGGWSSGSALAVAEGRVGSAMGNDTGVSIRTLSASCGVFRRRGEDEAVCAFGRQLEGTVFVITHAVGKESDR